MHEKFMQIALNLAERGLGNTFPNPSVGCVIVKNGEIIARAATDFGGRPHAEEQALKIADKRAKGAQVYVTLEPCAHKKNSCTNLLIKARVAEVFVATQDPDLRTNGKGIALLKKAGIKVIENILQKEAQELNKGFFTRIQKNRPFVTLKVAISADNKFLEARGRNIRWTTGAQARNAVHKMRAMHDAILFGARTVLADNPQYNCRLSGLQDFSPQKILLDRKLKVSHDYKIYNNNPLLVFAEKKQKLPKGAELIYHQNLTLELIVRTLAARGITRLMVETGPTLANAFLAADLVDEVAIFVAPEILGQRGKNYFATAIEKNFKLIKSQQYGEDKFLLLKKI